MGKVHPQTWVWTNTGLYRVSELAKDTEPDELIQGINLDTFTHVRLSARNELMWRIDTGKGYSFTAASDHLVMVYIDNLLREVPVERLSPGMVIFRKVGGPRITTMREIADTPVDRDWAFSCGEIFTTPITEIPLIVRQSPVEVIASFLRGYMKHNPHLTFKTWDDVDVFQQYLAYIGVESYHKFIVRNNAFKLYLHPGSEAIFADLLDFEYNEIGEHRLQLVREVPVLRIPAEWGFSQEERVPDSFFKELVLEELFTGYPYLYKVASSQIVSDYVLAVTPTSEYSDVYSIDGIANNLCACNGIITR